MNTILESADSSSKRIHYRIMILDENNSRSEELEDSFFTVFTVMRDKDKDKTVFQHFEKAKFFFVQNLSQLEQFPSSMAFNMIWIHIDFPNAIQQAEKFYSCNPFCYIVFYGNRDAKTILPYLHTRPIAFVQDITSPDAVYKEMICIYSQEEHKGMTLRLCSRNAFYDIAVKSILYCQSIGRKTYIFVDTTVNDVDATEDDIFVHQANKSGDYFSYEQNIQLDEVEKKLETCNFIRVHQSFLVNRVYIKGLSMKKQAWSLILADRYGQTIDIPVSERYKDRAKALFGE